MEFTKLYKLNNAKRDKLITFRLPGESLKALDKWCKDNGMKRSDLLVYFVNEHLFADNGK